MSAWILVYEGSNPAAEKLREALCTLANGYLGTRAAAPESHADDVHYPGTYIAGVFNRLTTNVDGRLVENEDMVNVPNWLPLTFRLDGGDWFDVQTVDLLEHRQELDLRQGILTRFIRFQDAQGRKTRLFQRRFVHMAFPHLAGLETTVTPENWSGRLQFHSALDGRVTNSGVKRYQGINNQHLTPLDAGEQGNETVYLTVETNQSHIRIAEAARTRLYDGTHAEPLTVERQLVQAPGYVGQEFSMEVAPEQSVTVEKTVALYTSRDHAISEPAQEARTALLRAGDFDTLLARHVLAWDHLWSACSVEVEAEDEQADLALKVHIFHLLQTASPNIVDLDVGVPARGLHGEAYRGHIFWDEIFIIPFLTLHMPTIARSLLLYRYRRLPEARWAARETGYAGALFPWQSGSNGREESQTLHLNPRSGRWVPDNSRLQRHINIAVAYNVWLYYEVTQDDDFLANYGAEMLVEIARFWASVAQFNHSLDRYEICGVMGPDEYHDAYPDAEDPGLHNNAYTNVMAAWVLRRAADALARIPEEQRDMLQNKAALTRQELERWDDIARKMRVIFHGDGIISQFEGYGELKEFDWAGYRVAYGDIQRLDRILEAEGDSPNRYKLSMQADVLMLFYLLSEGELRDLFQAMGYPFDQDTVRKNVDYYLQRTSHGSTLSRVVHSWILARTNRQGSWHLFREALDSDIADIQGGTTAEGIHLGAMGGTLDVVQTCYTGIQARQNMLWLDPILPPELRAIRLPLHYRGHRVDLHLTADILTVSACLCDAAPIIIRVRDTVARLQPGERRAFPASTVNLGTHRPG